MLFRQIVHEDLGCASYLVGDSDAGVAVVVDPRWEIDVYLELSRLHDVRIEHVLETHNHADHVSGHGRLASATGATIHVHSLADVDYPHEAFEDGWRLEIGDLEIEAVHTPGHRPEHTSFLLRDRARSDDPWAVLTGDSLFVGDVARPDLAVEPREGAAGIFRSLHDRLMPLADDVEVWPGHLGGSACGSAGIDEKASSTIGFERDNNRALRFEAEADFVEDAVDTLADPPPNVEHIVELNRGPLLERLGAPVSMPPGEVEAAVGDGAMVVDARTNTQFDEAHIPGAISASAYETGFATKVARVLDPETRVIVVAGSEGYELEAAALLACVGMPTVGYLEGGMTAWRAADREVQTIELIDTDDLARRMQNEELLVLDVRDEDEFAEQHIPGSVHIPYAHLPERMAELPRDATIAAICSGGKRSGLAASILQREGFDRVLHVADGGVGTWRRSGHPLES